jgi:chemotaxis family two-component system sensor kinase Cph1
MFQRFHSEDNYLGTGTGRAIYNMVVERNGGPIWGESNVGQDATFLLAIKEEGGGPV